MTSNQANPKEFVSVIVAAAAAVATAKGAEGIAKADGTSATDTAGRAAIAAWLAGCGGDPLREAVKAHGESTWNAVKGIVNGAQRLASQVAAKPLPLPERSDKEGNPQPWHVGERVVTELRESDLPDMASGGGDKLSTFISAMNKRNASFKARAEKVAEERTLAVQAALDSPEGREYLASDEAKAEEIRTAEDVILFAPAKAEEMATAGRVILAERDKAAEAAAEETALRDMVQTVIDGMAKLPDGMVSELAKAAAAESKARVKEAAKQTG